MANETESSLYSRLLSRLEEQSVYIAAKAKWDELDAQSQLYLKGAGAVLSAGGLIFLALTLAVQTYSLRSEILAKQKLLSLLQTGTEELKTLQETLPPNRASLETASGTTQMFIDSVAQAAGVDRAALNVSNETTVPEGKGETSAFKETTIDLTLKRIGIRQLVRLMYGLENSSRVAKVRNLQIDTKLDPEGYLDAVITASVFGPKDNAKDTRK
jgi:hypothetical protein